MRYAIEITVKNHVSGEARTMRLSYRYKTPQGAENAARRHTYSVIPDGKTVTSETSARVVPA